MTLQEDCKATFTPSQRLMMACNPESSTAQRNCYLEKSQKLKEQGDSSTWDNLKKLVRKLQSMTIKETREMLSSLLRCLRSVVN